MIRPPLKGVSGSPSWAQGGRRDGEGRGEEGAWRLTKQSRRPTFHRDVLDGKAEDNGPDHAQSHFHVPIHDFYRNSIGTLLAGAELTLPECPHHCMNHVGNQRPHSSTSRERKLFFKVPSGYHRCQERSLLGGDRDTRQVWSIPVGASQKARETDREEGQVSKSSQMIVMFWQLCEPSTPKSAGTTERNQSKGINPMPLLGH